MGTIKILLIEDDETIEQVIKTSKTTYLIIVK